METDNNTLHIFKTDIKSICPNCEVHKALNNHQEIQHWIIDHDDIDCVLRVTSATLNPAAIIRFINTFGYHCSEL